MSRTSYLISGLVVVLLVSHAHASVVITAVGLDSTTTNDWRTTTTAKLYDGDHNDVYGTAGYAAWSVTGNSGFFPPGQRGGVLTNGGGITLTEATVNTALSGNPFTHGSYFATYSTVDDPTVTPGPSVADEGLGFVYTYKAGESLPFDTLFHMFNFTIAAGGPTDFRLGVLDAGGNSQPSSFSFVAYSGGSTGTVSVAPATFGGLTRYAFFDVHGAVGDTFSLDVSYPTGGSGAQFLGLSGLTIDVLPIPEPSTLLLLGSGGLLLWRRARARR
jgi:PEP-CTERM motif